MVGNRVRVLTGDLAGQEGTLIEADPRLSISRLCLPGILLPGLAEPRYWIPNSAFVCIFPTINETKPCPTTP